MIWALDARSSCKIKALYKAFMQNLNTKCECTARETKAGIHEVKRAYLFFLLEYRTYAKCKATPIVFYWVSLVRETTCLNQFFFSNIDTF